MVAIEKMDGRYQEKKVQSTKKTFVEVTKEQAGRQGEGEALWLQVGGRGLSDRKEGLGRCLVGSWGAGSVGESELQSVREWGVHSWNIRNGLKVKSMGGPFMLLEFEDENEAERTLKRGTRRFNDKVLHLERWSVEAGCSKVGSLVENVWVRVVGLPLHCWSEKVFKRVGDVCGGFVEVDRETKNYSQIQWARILVKKRGNLFPGTMHLVVDDYCYDLQLWWERLPWFSKVLPMKKMTGGEKEKAREEWEVGSRVESRSSKRKESWRVAEDVGADPARKDGGEEKPVEDGKSGTDATFSVVGKKYGGKGKGKVGLNEGVIRLNHCKPNSEGSQDQLDWASKVKKKPNGLRDCWEEGQSSGVSGRAYSAGHLNSFWVGPDREDCRPNLVMREGQSFEALWAGTSFRPTKGSILKEARASLGQSRSERWFEEELLPSGMPSAAERCEKQRASLTDEWLMEENSRYSNLEPSAMCFWGGQVSSSSSLSGRKGAVIELDERCGNDAVEEESEGKLNFTPLRVCPAEVRDDQMGVGVSFMLEEGRGEGVEKEGEDEESWRYSCLVRFCQCLGMPSEGFEREILQLLNKIREKRDCSERVTGKKRKGKGLSRFDRELKKLEWSVNYGGIVEDWGHQESGR